MNIIYSKSEYSFHTKPTGNEYKKLTFTHYKTPVEELINSIEQGKSFTCQVYDSNIRHTNNFIAQRLFALDFDDTLTLFEIEAICRDFGLAYNFGYPTFSHAEGNPRYRIVFTCNGEVRDSALAIDLYKAFTIIFDSKNDLACKDLARIWAGTNKKVFRGDLVATFNPVTVFDIANELKYSRAGNRTRKSFNTNNIQVEKTGNNGNSILYRYSINGIPHISDEANTSGKLLDNWVSEDLYQCKLFKTFSEGNGTPELGDKLSDRELMCMASNLMAIEGGEKLYIACLKKNPNYSDEKFSKISWLRNQKHYKTYLIGNYSPYAEDKSSQFQTFPEILKKKGRVEIDPTFKLDLYTLTEAEAMLLEANKRISADTGNTIYLVKVMPGLGKTQYWKDKPGVVIGFPNNSLKNEQYLSSGLPDDKKMVTPEALSKFSGPVKSYLSALYQKGLNEIAFFKIKDLANGKALFEDGHIDYGDMDCAADYLLKNKAINDADVDKTVFTTHTRMIHQTFKHSTYVFDENAFNTIFEHQKTTVKELLAVKEHLRLRNITSSELDEVLNIKDSDLHSTPRFCDYVETVKEIIRGDRFNTNVLKFFHSSRFMFDGEYIHYEINHIDKLPTDKKIVFLDATGSESFFRLIFGERLKVVDISNVELEGSIEQDTSKSCTKAGLDKYHERISMKVGDLPVITHNAYKKYFQNPVETMHFGNLTGSNQLSGKNFCVVGTMTYHPTYYKFMAGMLSIKCDNFKMKNLKVTYNGRRFWFTTFENPELQRLHLEQVEGELIQGVHRGRLIRTPAKVYLYSNFPLLQANYIN